MANTNNHQQWQQLVGYGVYGYGGESWMMNEEEEEEKYLSSFPPGYRFCPTDEELVVHYLRNKVSKKILPPNRILEVDLSKYSPQVLTEMYPHHREGNCWYLFTPRARKYPNGVRPNRAAGDGYWKPTGSDRQICYGDQRVGYKKALDYHEGNHEKGKKTNWKMHEDRTEEKSAPARNINNGGDPMQLDEWVLCKIYKNSKGTNKNQQDHSEEPETSNHSKGKKIKKKMKKKNQQAHSEESEISNLDEDLSQQKASDSALKLISTSSKPLKINEPFETSSSESPFQGFTNQVVLSESNMSLVEPSSSNMMIFGSLNNGQDIVDDEYDKFFNGLLDFGNLEYQWS